LPGFCLSHRPTSRTYSIAQRAIYIIITTETLS
jgi:hypothetical protein